MSLKSSAGKGFSLVELLLVASLSAMIFFALFSSYSGGIRIWRAINSMDSAADRRFIVSTEKMRNELSEYIRDFKEINFEGDAERLAFPCLLDLEIVTIIYEYDKGQRALMKKVSKLSTSLKEKMKKNATELFDVDDFRFSYLVYDLKNKTNSWVASFTEDDGQFPLAIRFQGTRAEKSINEYVFIPQ